jgi:hypothetical protein
MNTLTTLKRTLELVGGSQPSAWMAGSLEELTAQLRAAVAAIESGTPVNRDELRLLFAPTGPLQDLSIDNGWGDEFLSLAQQMDAFLSEGRG